MNIGVKIENISDLKGEVILEELKDMDVKHLEIQIKDCNKESRFFTEDFSKYILNIVNSTGLQLVFMVF